MHLSYTETNDCHSHDSVDTASSGIAPLGSYDVPVGSGGATPGRARSNALGPG